MRPILPFLMADGNEKPHRQLHLAGIVPLRRIGTDGANPKDRLALVLDGYSPNLRIITRSMSVDQLNNLAAIMVDEIINRDPQFSGFELMTTGMASLGPPASCKSSELQNIVIEIANGDLRKDEASAYNAGDRKRRQAIGIKIAMGIEHAKTCLHCKIIMQADPHRNRRTKLTLSRIIQPHLAALTTSRGGRA